MSDTDDKHDEFSVLNFVQDSIVADTESSQPLKIAFQDCTGTGSLRQLIDRRDDSRPVQLRHTAQLLGSAPLNPYREAHAGPETNPVPGRWGRGAGR